MLCQLFLSDLPAMARPSPSRFPLRSTLPAFHQLLMPNWTMLLVHDLGNWHSIVCCLPDSLLLGGTAINGLDAPSAHCASASFVPLLQCLACWVLSAELGALGPRHLFHRSVIDNSDARVVPTSGQLSHWIHSPMSSLDFMVS